MADPAVPDGGPDPTGDPAPEAILGTTTLPSPREQTRSVDRRVLVAGGALLVVVVAVIAVIVHGNGGSTSTVHSAAPSRGGPVVPVFADSGHALTDTATVVTEVKALLGHQLPAAAGLASAPASPGAGAALGAGLLLSDPALPGCVSTLEDGHSLLGIDRVRYQGALSLVVVTTGDDPTAAVAWVVGARCAEPGGDGIRTIVTTTR
jgi:hypothetical protein